MKNKKNKVNKQAVKEKEEGIKTTGVVTKIHGAMYEITDDQTGIKILATLNGKMKMNSIKLTIGDKVDVELSAYDLTRGRIIYRYR